jgi:hypothetical protein
MAVCLELFVYLWTLDIYVDEAGVDGSPAFCGSAYDVVLVKKDGYMGGEYPANQAEIDAACADASLPPVVGGGVAGSVALLAGVIGVLAFPRRRLVESAAA